MTVGGNAFVTFERGQEKLPALVRIVPMIGDARAGDALSYQYSVTFDSLLAFSTGPVLEGDTMRWNGTRYELHFPVDALNGQVTAYFLDVQ